MAALIPLSTFAHHAWRCWGSLKLRAILLPIVWFGLGVAPLHAQEFPSKPIRFIIPYAAGGSGDFLGRLFADHLARVIGRPVLVENKPGAATNIGLEQIARAEPDGHTIMMATSQTVINMVNGPVPSVDLFDGLSHIAMIAEMSLVIASNPNASLNSVKEMIAKAQTHRLTIGHAQFEAHVKFLSMVTSAPIDSIPYKGGAQSVLAALGGETSLVAAYVPVVMSHIRAGKLRVIGVAATSRVAALPDAPTFAEQGFPKFTNSVWYSIVAPKGIPDKVRQTLTNITLTVAKDPQFVERLQGGGGEALARPPAEAIAIMRDELKLWSELAKSK